MRSINSIIARQLMESPQQAESNDNSEIIPEQPEFIERFSEDVQESYEIAARAASSVFRRRFRVLRLLKNAYVKLYNENRAWPALRGDLLRLLRMVKAWALGDYKQIPWRSLIYAIGGIIYFVVPIDLIPDAIPGLGYLDDAAVIGAVVHAIRKDLREFEQWEHQLEGAPDNVKHISAAA